MKTDTNVRGCKHGWSNKKDCGMCGISQDEPYKNWCCECGREIKGQRYRNFKLSSNQTDIIFTVGQCCVRGSIDNL